MRKAPIARQVGYKKIGGRINDGDHAEVKDKRAAYFKIESADVCLSCMNESCIGICEKIRAIERDIANKERHTQNRKINFYGKKYPYKGEMLTVTQISQASGVAVSTLRKRLQSGMPLEKALYKEARK